MLASDGHIRVESGALELPGSDVVITSEPDADDVRAIADRAPASVIVVASGREVCQAVLEATLFPSPRVVGVTAGADDVAAVAGAILFDRRSEHDCLVAGEDGYAPARARLGSRGVRELL